MSAAPIPSWKERLKSCFRWRHRLMHVFGAPAAIGAATAVAGAAALNPDAGFGLGVLVAGIGSLIAGYYVTAGFDRKLVERLQEEQREEQEHQASEEILRTLQTADRELQPVLQSILFDYDAIEGQFADGIDDQVEAILQTSRKDLRALRDRAVALVHLQGRLRAIIAQTDGRKLYEQVQQMGKRLEHTEAGGVRDALETALESTQRTYGQWRAAVDKQQQIVTVLTIIQSNLQQFKLAMELRKADAAMGAQETGPEVNELQARLIAAGEACDELIGRSSTRSRRRSRASS
jgi:hypothetical protein